MDCATVLAKLWAAEFTPTGDSERGGAALLGAIYASEVIQCLVEVAWSGDVDAAISVNMWAKVSFLENFQRRFQSI
jgi:hypothetical protein